MQAGRRADATGAFREGLTIIAPLVERNARAFGDVAGRLGQEYKTACQAAAITPDAAMLERVARAIGVDEEPDSDKTGGWRIDKYSYNEFTNTFEFPLFASVKYV